MSSTAIYLDSFCGFRYAILSFCSSSATALSTMHLIHCRPGAGLCMQNKNRYAFTANSFSVPFALFHCNSSINESFRASCFTVSLSVLRTPPIHHNQLTSSAPETNVHRLLLLSNILSRHIDFQLFQCQSTSSHLPKFSDNSTANALLIWCWISLSQVPSL